MDEQEQEDLLGTTPPHPMEHNFGAGAGQSLHAATEAAWSLYISKLLDEAKLDSMKTTMTFIEAIKTASLYDEWSKLNEDTLYKL